MKYYKQIILGSLVTLILGACDLNSGSSSTSSPQSCTFNPPQPPNPIPANYNWRPLAEQWCQQLTDCGSVSATCVDDYLNTINNPPAGITIVDNPPSTPSATTGSEGVKEDDGFEDLICENSEEYLSGTISCYMEQQQEGVKPGSGST